MEFDEQKLEVSGVSFAALCFAICVLLGLMTSLHLKQAVLTFPHHRHHYRHHCYYGCVITTSTATSATTTTHIATILAGLRAVPDAAVGAAGALRRPYGLLTGACVHVCLKRACVHVCLKRACVVEIYLRSLQHSAFGPTPTAPWAPH